LTPISKKVRKWVGDGGDVLGRNVENKESALLLLLTIWHAVLALLLFLRNKKVFIWCAHAQCL
jgi:hypothetical protein